METRDVLAKVKLVLCDVDGTLTIDRDTYNLHPEVVRYVRILEDGGVKVGLVSGNALPVLFGLAKYLGCSGGLAAENGSVILYGDEIIVTCPICGEVLKIADLVEKEVCDVAWRTWQDRYRLCDAAFKVKGSLSYDELAKVIDGVIKRLGYGDLIQVRSSGFAVHLIPKGCGKHLGALKLMELNGVNRGETLAIGDSVTDLELLQVVGVPVAVSNADEELKKVALIVTSKPSGEGFVELARSILRAKGLL